MRSRALAAAGALLAVIAATPALASSSRPTPEVIGLVGAIPAWARHADPVAAVPGNAVVNVALLLRGRDTAGLQRFDAAVSDPQSPAYRHFLSQADYAARFAPSAAAAAATRRWLHSAGLTVDGTSPHHTLVYAHAPASIVASAFRTRLAMFRVAGTLLRAPLAEPTIPAALGSSVVAVSGLAQTPLAPTAAPAPAFVNARPCSRYYGQLTATKQPTYRGRHVPYALCGYRPSQLRSAYGVAQTGLTGKGATVAVVDAFASATVEQDTNAFARRQGLPPFRPGQFAQVLYPGATSLPELKLGALVEVDPQGWQGEETLDVEAIHEMAPAAKVIYYAGTNAAAADPGLYVAETEAVEAGKANVISNSWGLPDDDPLPTDQLMFDADAGEAAAEGITIDFSSGDDGDEVKNLGERDADFPSTSPKVTAVGGTNLRIGRSGNWLGETYWGTEKVPLKAGKWDFAHSIYGGAGGGGVSTTYAEPAWQRAVVPASEATFGGVKPGRVVPDVSMVSDPTTAVLIGETMTFPGGKARFAQFSIGGTSVACPLFSGVLALAVQRNHGHGLGMIAPTLYRHARTGAGRRAMFHDPSGVARRNGRSSYANVRVNYSNPADASSPKLATLRLLGNLGTLHRRTGYDDSTGLGSPKVPGLIRALT